MAPAFAHGTTRPFSSMTIIALVFVALTSVLGSITIGLFLIRSRQHRLPASTTQIHVQVEVEKCRDATSPSSILPFPVVTTRPLSTSTLWVRMLMDKLKRRCSNEAMPGASLPSPPVDDRYTELPPSPRDCQAPVRRELWLAFETDASLATFDNDPLEDGGGYRGQFPLPASEDGSGGSSAVSTPALVSGTASPASTWEPQTPPVLSPTIYARRPLIQAVTFPDSARLLSAIGPTCEASPVGVKGPIQEVLKIPETDCADQRSTRAGGSPPPSNFVGSVCDSPPNAPPDSSFPSDTSTVYELNADGDKRYGALLNAFSASFSASSLGFSGSERDSDSQTDSVHFHDHGPEFGIVCIASFGGRVNSDERQGYDDYERDIGTLALHRSYSLAEYSFLAI